MTPQWTCGLDQVWLMLLNLTNSTHLICQSRQLIVSSKIFTSFFYDTTASPLSSYFSASSVSILLIGITPSKILSKSQRDVKAIWNQSHPTDIIIKAECESNIISANAFADWFDVSFCGSVPNLMLSSLLVLTTYVHSFRNLLHIDLLSY